MFDTLKAMAIFAEVVKRGSFRQAAKHLGLSPSVVSYHVSQLEQKTGSALLYRSTRKLSLSHEGEILYQHSLQMLNAASDGLALLSDNQTERSGTLRLSLPTALNGSWHNEKLIEFALSFPNIQLHIDYTDSHSDIIDERVDLTIRVGELSNSDLKAVKIGVMERVLVCSPTFYKRQPAPQSPDDLSSWRWIKLSQLPNKRTFFASGESVEVSFHSQISVNSVEAIRQFCMQGLGLAVLGNDQAADDIAKGSLLRVLPKWTVEPLPLYAIWSKNVSENSNVKLLLSYMKGHA